MRITLHFQFQIRDMCSSYFIENVTQMSGEKKLSNKVVNDICKKTILPTPRSVYREFILL